MNNEWVIHVWGKKRDVLELNDVERFHIDVLKSLKNEHKVFNKILVNIAMDDIDDNNLFDFLKSNIREALNNDNVEFKCCQNDILLGEYVTFRPYVFDRIGEDVNIFYTHFKGYKTFLRINRESYPVRVSDLCEMFWSYIMYRYSLDSDVYGKLNDHCTCSWFVLKDDKAREYYNGWWKQLLDKNPEFNEFIADDLKKHSPGSFNWYNMKNIAKSLEGKDFVRNISVDTLKEASTETGCLCTHFCELYLMQFLKDEECYSVKDFSNEWGELNEVLYVSLYPSKMIAKELIDDFETYLIENKLI